MEFIPEMNIILSVRFTSITILGKKFIFKENCIIDQLNLILICLLCLKKPDTYYFLLTLLSMPALTQTPDAAALEFLTELGESGSTSSDRDDESKTGGYKSFVQNEYGGS